jgi:IS5 family transposase
LTRCSHLDCRAAIGGDNRDEMKGKPVKWRVAAKRGKIKAMQEGPLKDLVIAVERTKAQIRARVEHPFHVVKNLFRHRKVRYKGLAKNTAQLFRGARTKSWTTWR